MLLNPLPLSQTSRIPLERDMLYGRPLFSYQIGVVRVGQAQVKPREGHFGLVLRVSVVL